MAGEDQGTPEADGFSMMSIDARRHGSEHSGVMDWELMFGSFKGFLNFRFSSIVWNFCWGEGGGFQFIPNLKRRLTKHSHRHA